MNILPRWLWGAIAATLLPTCLPTIYFGWFDLTSPYPNGTTVLLIFIVAFVISLGHVAFLGIPGLFLLRKIRKFTVWAISLLGFLAGCLPMGLWSWPLKSSLRGTSYTYWDGEKMVSSMIDGIPTHVGWISYGEGVITMGVLGAVSGLAFWVAWNKSGSIGWSR